MAKKRRRGRKTKGPSERGQELDRVLDGYDGSSEDEAFSRRLSRALAGFPGWLPHLVKRARKGPAGRRKAAAAALLLSDTGAGREKLLACLASSTSPAWLKRHALALSESLVSGEQAERIEKDLDVSDRDALLRRATGGDRVAIELLLDEGEDEFLAELFDGEPGVAELICDCLLDHQSETAGRILRIAGLRSGGSGRSKLIRKTAHALKQRGVAVSFHTAEGETDLGETHEGETEEGERGAGLQQRAFVGPIGPSGERHVVVSAGRSGESARHVFFAAIRDREGLVMFEQGSMSPRQERDLLASWQNEEQESAFQEVSPAWAWEVLRRAYARGREAACRVPEAFVLSRHQWELHGLCDGAEISASVDSSGDVPAREIAALAKSYPMKIWGLDDDLIENWARELEEVESSPLLLGSELSLSRKEKVFEKFAELLFDENRRGFYRQRLEETGRFLSASGRQQEASAALAAADLLKNGSAVAKNPFCLSLLESRVAERQKRNASEPSLIERPGSPASLPDEPG